MKKYSKLMSLVLRHKPEELGLILDAQGWIMVSDLVKGMRKRYSEFSLALLDEVVTTNDKKRFEYDPSGWKIRACQGHSIDVDLGLAPTEPPSALYHGTSQQSVDMIMESDGIQKMLRHAVQLSPDKTTAYYVGRRHGGKTVLLEIAAKVMYDEGHKIYRTSNNVWLTEWVPKEFITKTIHGYDPSEELIP